MTPGADWPSPARAGAQGAHAPWGQPATGSVGAGGQLGAVCGSDFGQVKSDPCQGRVLSEEGAQPSPSSSLLFQANGQELGLPRGRSTGVLSASFSQEDSFTSSGEGREGFKSQRPRLLTTSEGGGCCSPGIPTLSTANYLGPHSPPSWGRPALCRRLWQLLVSTGHSRLPVEKCWTSPQAGVPGGLSGGLKGLPGAPTWRAGLPVP